MKIDGTHFFNAPRDKVWELLLDPKVIAQCVPGCEELKEVAPDQYEATMKVGIAGGKETCKGKISLKEKRPPIHCILSGEGSGAPGFLQGDVVVDLEEKEGKTLVRFSTDAKVGGLIAGVGQRMIGGVAKMMMDQFFKKMEEFV